MINYYVLDKNDITKQIWYGTAREIVREFKMQSIRQFNKIAYSAKNLDYNGMIFIEDDLAKKRNGKRKRYNEDISSSNIKRSLFMDYGITKIINGVETKCFFINDENNIHFYCSHGGVIYSVHNDGKIVEIKHAINQSGYHYVRIRYAFRYVILCVHEIMFKLYDDVNFNPRIDSVKYLDNDKSNLKIENMKIIRHSRKKEVKGMIDYGV